MELVPWRNRHERSSVGGNGNGESSGKGITTKSKRENLAARVAASGRSPSESGGEDVAPIEVELLPAEDIYRLAGIMQPSKGYSIKKVVGMLHSQHIRGLSKEMKRAAVLMALEAAGVSLAQVQLDAKARQDALDAHETGQRKQIEAEWTRKTEEISQIQNEMERVKTHFMARISRNLDAIAREKATFSSWITIKQQEAQSMEEALELCSKLPIPEAAASATEADSATVVVGGQVSDRASALNLDIHLARAASNKTM
jgi:hypothetical protein